jgi:glycosyltransferase involved in cell wall biosynthesis
VGTPLPNPTRENGKRPHIVLVAWKIAPPRHPAGDLAKIVPLAAEHVDFTVITSELPEVLRPLVRWHRAPAPRSWGRLTWAIFFITAWVRLRGVRGDLVHTLGAAPVVPARVDFASIIFCHSLYHSSLGGRPSRGLPGLWRLARAFSLGLERACYGRVRVLGAECASSKRTLERLFPGLDVQVVPTFPIDTERFRPDTAAHEELRCAEGVGSRETVALFVGRDWELKGLDVAIQALAEATRLGGSRLSLWVLGDGDVRKYEAMAAGAGVAQRVRFFGNRNDIERYFQAADVFVLPTLCETFCRAAYEAAACGLPVIATAVDGVTELIGDSEAGQLVERDAASVGRALVRLAADPELRARLGNEGRRRSLECTVERSVDALLAMYDRLLTDVRPAEPAAAPTAATG